MGMPGSASRPRNSALIEYALANSITYFSYMFQVFFHIDTIAYLIFGINLFLILVFPIFFRSKAAVIAVSSYFISLGVLRYFALLASEGKLASSLFMALPTILYVISLFAFGHVLSGISRIAGVIYYGVAIATGILSMLHYIVPGYEFYYYYLGIVFMLLLATAWLLVALKVFKSSG